MHSLAAAALAARMAGRGEVEALMKGSQYTDEFLAAIITREAGCALSSASPTAS
jgi:hypothetical protein